ncbi:MAG: hypothetical protein ACJ78Q_18340 [Chloroflexia bacterium]
MADSEHTEGTHPAGKPAVAAQGEIIGKPTMLVKYDGMLDAETVLSCLKRVNYPLEDVSILFRVEGSDQVMDLTTGHMAAGQSLTDEELSARKSQSGQTLVLLHPTAEQAPAVRQALTEIGHPNLHPEIEYAGETRAHGRPGGVDRHDEHVS